MGGQNIGVISLYKLKHTVLQRGIFILIECVTKIIQQLLLLIIFAKFGSPQDLNYYAIGISIVAPFTMLASLQLRTLAAADLKNGFGTDVYWYVRLAGNLLLLSGVLLAVFLAGYQMELVAITLIVALSKSVDLASELAYGLRQRQNRESLIAMSALLKLIGSCAATLFLCVNNFSTATVLIANLIVNLVVLYFIDISRRPDFSPNLVRRGPFPFLGVSTRERILELFKKSFPFALASFITSLVIMIPRYQLSYEQVGAFTAIFSIVAGMTQIVGVLGQSSIPYFAESFHLKNQRKIWSRLFSNLAISLACSCIVICGAFFGGELLIRKLFNAEISHYDTATMMLSVSTLFTFQLVQVSWLLLSTRDVRYTLLVSIVGMLFVLPFSFFLIPRWEINGAVIVTIIGNVAMLITSFILAPCAVRFRCSDSHDI